MFFSSMRRIDNVWVSFSRVSPGFPRCRTILCSDMYHQWLPVPIYRQTFRARFTNCCMYVWLTVPSEAYIQWQQLHAVITWICLFDQSLDLYSLAVPIKILQLRATSVYLPLSRVDLPGELADYQTPANIQTQCEGWCDVLFHKHRRMVTHWHDRRQNNEITYRVKTCLIS